MRVECVRKAFENEWVAGGGDAIPQNQDKLVWLNVLYVYKTRTLLDEIVAAHLLVIWYTIHVKGVSRPPDILSQYNTDVLIHAQDSTRSHYKEIRTHKTRMFLFLIFSPCFLYSSFA